MKSANWVFLSLVAMGHAEAGRNLVVYYSDGTVSCTPVSKIDSIKFTGPFVTTGLVAYYPFQGNADDLGGKGLHGAVHGATLTTGRDGRDNGAYSFGPDRYIDVPNDPALNNLEGLTLEVWVKGRSPSGSTGVDQCIIGKGWDHQGDVHRAYNLHWDHNWAGMHFNVASPGEVVLGARAKYDTGWHHIAATYDGVRMRLFVDGNLDTEAPQSGVIPASPLGLQIGRISPYYGDHFCGDIDLVRIYDRALSTEEVRQNMQAAE